jgi:uncharacterized protein YecE (DUF72 family)
MLISLMKGAVYIGTSGWYYKQWHATFYPDGLSKPKLLPYYASQFPTVEINASFYKLLTQKTVADWTRKVPDDFVFAIKGSRFITHMKKLTEVGPGLEKFFDSIHGFQKKLGPILWQLPPNLRKDLTRLDEFLELLPRKYGHAVEFRHTSWVDDEVFALLQKHQAAHVWLSSLAMPMNFTVTAPFIFLRFHGLQGGYNHDYTRAELQPWADQLNAQARRGQTAFAFFNNDGNTRAPQNAVTLMEMVSRHAVRPHPAQAAA